MSSSSITIATADLHDAAHEQAILELLDVLASWPDDHGKSLSDEVKRTLVPRLREVPGAMVLLAYDSGIPVGLAVCFLGFSTFNARPLINIHDLVVRAESRGQGVGRMLLKHIEQAARDRDCCRVTLEVYEDNHGAKQLYERDGFKIAPVGSSAQLFLIKPL